MMLAWLRRRYWAVETERQGPKQLEFIVTDYPILLHGARQRLDQPQTDPGGRTLQEIERRIQLRKVGAGEQRFVRQLERVPEVGKKRFGRGRWASHKVGHGAADQLQLGLNVVEFAGRHGR